MRDLNNKVAWITGAGTGIGEAGAANAALSAISMLAISDESLALKLAEFREKQQQSVFAMTLPPTAD